MKIVQDGEVADVSDDTATFMIGRGYATAYEEVPEKGEPEQDELPVAPKPAPSPKAPSKAPEGK